MGGGFCIWTEARIGRSWSSWGLLYGGMGTVGRALVSSLGHPGRRSGRALVVLRESLVLLGWLTGSGLGPRTDPNFGMMFHKRGNAAPSRFVWYRLQ